MKVLLVSGKQSRSLEGLTAVRDVTFEDTIVWSRDRNGSGDDARLGIGDIV